MACPRSCPSQMLLLTQSGSLDQVLVEEGEVVRAGAEIATLSNTDLTLELEELRGQYARLNLFIQELESMSSTSFGAASQIAETEAQRSSIEKRIKLKEEQIAQLTVKASRDGKLFSPPNVPKKSTNETELETWTETPLSPKNRGCYLEANALVGMIGDPEKMEAILVVNHSDVKLLEPGQKVIALLQQFRKATNRGQANQ